MDESVRPCRIDEGVRRLRDAQESKLQETQDKIDHVKSLSASQTATKTIREDALASVKRNLEEALDAAEQQEKNQAEKFSA